MIDRAAVPDEGFTGVAVVVAVCVGRGVVVAVGVAVCVGAAVAVAVCVGKGVPVAVAMPVGAAVAVCVGWGVPVAVGLGGVGEITLVDCGVGTLVAVVVAGKPVDVGSGVPLVGVMAGAVPVTDGMGLLVGAADAAPVAAGVAVAEPAGWRILRVAVQLPLLSEKPLSLAPRPRRLSAGTMNPLILPTSKGTPLPSRPRREKQGSPGAVMSSPAIQLGSPAGVWPGSPPANDARPEAVMPTDEPAGRSSPVSVQGWLTGTDRVSVTGLGRAITAIQLPELSLKQQD